MHTKWIVQFVEKDKLKRNVSLILTTILLLSIISPLLNFQTTKADVTSGVINPDPSRFSPLVSPSSQSLTLNSVTSWYWTSKTTVNAVAQEDTNGDGQIEIVTGGSYFDGTRTVAQLVVWNSSNLTPEKITTWYWTGNTTINSVAIGDVNGDTKPEIVTGGTFFDGSRNVAQLVVWNCNSLAAEKITSWYWTSDTIIKSIAIGDVNADNQNEIVSSGYFNDGTRNVAQLIVWNGASLAVEKLTSWFWNGNTVINSVSIGNVDGDNQIEIVTGGSFFDGARNVAQLIEWSGSSLLVDRLMTWYWTSNTTINSVALGDVDADGQVEVVTGGSFFDGSRNNAQLVEWNGASLTVDRLTSWYWTSNTIVNSVAIGDVDSDGQSEIVTGGQFNDGTRDNAQIVIWSGSSLTAKNIKSWYWTSNSTINSVAKGDFNADFTKEIVTGGTFNDGIRQNSQLITWELIYTPSYKVYGLNFSPYILDSQNPNLGAVVNETQIRSLMTAIKPYTNWVRTFGCTSGQEVEGRVAHELG